jgi:hypothetical protein
MPRGPKSEKRPADVISNAVHVMRIATGEIEESATPDHDFASAVLADVSALNVAEVAQVLFRPRHLGRIEDGSAGQYPADARRILRLGSILRRERDQDSEHGGDAADSRSARSRCELLSSHCLPGAIRGSGRQTACACRIIIRGEVHGASRLVGQYSSANMMVMTRSVTDESAGSGE